ncbi:TolC family protein [Flavobacteriaceae sp. LMIT009]
MHRIAILLVFILVGIQSYSQNFKIGILTDKLDGRSTPLLNQLKEEIKAVVGEDATINFSQENVLSNNFNLKYALENYQTLLNNDVDIIIAFGVVNNSVISKLGTYEKPTIVFGALSEELRNNETTATHINNYTSLITSQSYSEDLRLLKQLANPKIVGIAVEEAFLENLPIKEAFDRIITDLDLQMKFIAFENLDDITNNLEAIDALYLAGGFYLNDEEIKTLAKELITKKLPSFTANPVIDVQNGLLATNHNQSELNQIFRRIALTVESVVNGENLSELDTMLESRNQLTINFNTAEKIDLPLKYSLIATTSFIGDPKEVVADKIYNLVSVMQEAISKNLKLKTVEQDISLTEKDIQIAKSNYLPNLTAGANSTYIDPKLAEVGNGQNPEFNTTGNLTLQQTIFSESANATISIQKSLRAAQEANYNSEALNTVFDVANAYFTALILKANLSVQNQNLELTKYNLKIAEENFEAGQSGKSDVLRFRSEMAQNTQQMVEAINQLEQGYYALNQLLNNPINTKIDVEEAELKEGIFKNYNYEQLGQFLDDPRLRDPFVKFLVEEAFKNAPELKAIEYNLEATERSNRLYGAGRFLPSIALQGQYIYEFSRSGAGSTFPPNFPAIPDGYYTFGLNVSLPLFNQNKQNLNKQIASIQKNQLEISRDNIKLNIERNINDAVLELVNQVSNIELSRLFEETAEEALDLTQTSYANGAVNIVQLLDAQNNYLQAQLASANAAYNYLLSSMLLERSLGLFFLLEEEEEREAFAQRFLEFMQKND